mmetsp:Transcript_41026/g.73975  ORF Transcript_41026/g.73975 Transcript_41026/m.73975 type:complete len:246 (-) Transcript_41026:116-853(-)
MRFVVIPGQVETRKKEFARIVSVRVHGLRPPRKKRPPINPHAKERILLSRPRIPPLPRDPILLHRIPHQFVLSEFDDFVSDPGSLGDGHPVDVRGNNPEVGVRDLLVGEEPAVADDAQEESVAWEGADAVLFVQLLQGIGHSLDLFGVDAVLFLWIDAEGKSCWGIFFEGSELLLLLDGKHCRLGRYLKRLRKTRSNRSWISEVLLELATIMVVWLRLRLDTVVVVAESSKRRELAGIVRSKEEQ